MLSSTLGLAIGFASCLIIARFVNHQYSFDRMLVDSDRVYRMIEKRTINGHEEINTGIPYFFVRTMVQDFPEVESATAFAGPFANQQVTVANVDGTRKHFLESSVLLADSSFFKVLGFKMIHGDATTALKDPNSVVLSQSTAAKYFGEHNPIGQSIKIGRRNSTITGICEDPPSNSHFKFSYLVSSTSVGWLSQEKFNLRTAFCYFKLKSETSVINLESKFPDMIRNYVGQEIERVNNISWEDYIETGYGFEYALQPISAIHLDSKAPGGMKAGGSRITLEVLIGVVFLILIIACINFMTLSTARSMERAREVGIRKVLGTRRSTIILQFLFECLVLITCSAILAFLLVQLSLPFFNEFLESNIQMPLVPSTILKSLILIATVTLLSGIYPAHILSSFKPTSILKGTSTGPPKGKNIMSGLIVFQFWISMILITSTFMINRQVEFLRKKDLGFDKQNLLIIEGLFNQDPNYAKPFLSEVKNLPQIKNASGSLWVQGFQGVWSDEYRNAERSEVSSLNRVVLGDGIAEVLGLHLLEGSLFTPVTNDSLSVILNESAVKTLGIENPIGQKITLVNHDGGSIRNTHFTIKGIVKDFNYMSLYHEIEPLVIMSNERFFGRISYIVARATNEGNENLLTELESLWVDHFPDKPFSWRFLDTVLNNKYRSEKKLSRIFTAFSMLSIFISLVGLLALSSYKIRLRRKEIGIRKVIGASFTNILLLLSKGFAKTIMISFVLAIPVTIYALNLWLENFAFRVPLTVTVFLISSLAIVTMTFMILLIQVAKAASTQPSEVLSND